MSTANKSIRVRKGLEQGFIGVLRLGAVILCFLVSVARGLGWGFKGRVVGLHKALVVSEGFHVGSNKVSRWFGNDTFFNCFVGLGFRV